jgi:hypothetical protein
VLGESGMEREGEIKSSELSEHLSSLVHNLSSVDVNENFSGTYYLY